MTRSDLKIAGWLGAIALAVFTLGGLCVSLWLLAHPEPKNPPTSTPVIAEPAP